MAILNANDIAAVKAAVDAAIDSLHSSLRELNREIWTHPELAYKEHRAHDRICDFLEQQGFGVTRHAYGLETSFEAISGSGGALVNFNAEYDALPDIGHACGHNLIATSSVTAFLALSFALRKFGIPGRTQLLGTPAEENGGGKAQLIDAGAYKGVDVSLMAHSCSKHLFPDIDEVGIAGTLMNARKKLFCEFSGRTAHAGGNPWDGVNALDALVSAYNNVSVLRQQIKPDERIHCAFLETPKVANVIPASTQAVWQVRSPSMQGLTRLVGRVRNCIDAAGLASGCQVRIQEDELYADVRLNDTLCERYQVHMHRYGRNVRKDYEKVLTASSDIGSMLYRELPLTNTGNVSYVTPTLHTMFMIPAPEGASPHHPSFTAAAGTDQAHEEALVVGKSLALIGWDMLTQQALLDTAQLQWRENIHPSVDKAAL